jgi:hypothetical protein
MKNKLSPGGVYFLAEIVGESGGGSFGMVFFCCSPGGKDDYLHPGGAAQIYGICFHSKSDIISNI